MKKRFLTVLGAIAMAGVVALGAFIAWSAYRGISRGIEGKAFVDRAIPAIARNWDRQELLDRAAPELRAEATPEQLDTVFGTLTKLGPMVEYQGAKGEAVTTYTTSSGSVVTAKYEAKGRFQNGGAIFQIVLVKRDGHWMILNFHVDFPPAEGRAEHT